MEKHVKAGELPSALISRCPRIRRADLETFLHGRTARGWRPYAPDPPRGAKHFECYAAAKKLPVALR